MTGLHIRLTQEEFSRLGIRQWGLPSLIQPGSKWKWKDKDTGDWWQTTIVDHYGGDPDMVSFESRIIEVVG